MDPFDPLFELDPLEPWDTYARRNNIPSPPIRPTPRQEITEPPRQSKVKSVLPAYSFDPSPVPEAPQPTWNVATESVGIVNPSIIEVQVQSGPQYFIPAHM